MRAPDSANKAENESSHSFGVNFGVSVTCVCVASTWSSRLQHLHSAKHTLTIRVSVIVWTIFSHIRINKLLDIYNQRFVVINVSSHILLCEPYMSLVACCFVSHLSFDLIADVSHFIHSFYATFVVCIITFSRCYDDESYCCLLNGAFFRTIKSMNCETFCTNPLRPHKLYKMHSTNKSYSMLNMCQLIAIYLISIYRNWPCKLTDWQSLKINRMKVDRSLRKQSW